MTRYYDEKRYRIAPWRGRYGDQAHALRLHPHREKIAAAIQRKKAQLRRIEEQIRQLEVLEQSCDGFVLEDVVVREMWGPPEETDNYEISLVSRTEVRSADMYPNAHNNGKTYGLRLYQDGYPYRQEIFRGYGHTREQAVEGARAWVLRKEMAPERWKEP